MKILRFLKFLVPTCLVIAIAISLYFFFLPRNLSFPDFDRVSYSFQVQSNFAELEKAEIDKIKEVCSKGHGSLHEFYSKPEIVLKFEKQNRKEPEYVSLFLQDGFLFQGEYLAAWYDRMRGFPSYCYVLSDQQKKYFADFINNKKVASENPVVPLAADPVLNQTIEKTN